MTQLRVESQEKLCRVEQEQQDNLKLLQAVTMLRGRLDEAKETAETKGTS